MRIDPCKGCGEMIDIASDHAPDCTHGDPECHCIAPSPVIGSAVLQTGAVIENAFAMVKLRFHDDGTVTWQRLWNQ